MRIVHRRHERQLRLDQRALQREHDAVLAGVRVDHLGVELQVRLVLLLGVLEVHVAVVQREHNAVHVAAQAQEDCLGRHAAHARAHHATERHVAHAHKVFRKHARLQTQLQHTVGHGVADDARLVHRADLVRARVRRERINVLVGHTRNVNKSLHVLALHVTQQAPLARHTHDARLDLGTDRECIGQRAPIRERRTQREDMRRTA